MLNFGTTLFSEQGKIILQLVDKTENDKFILLVLHHSSSEFGSFAYA